MSRGLQNNNPGNIRISRDVFHGEIVPSRDRAFKQFETMSHGYRAMFVVLGTYLNRGLNTITKIINAYAPDNENDTQAYVAGVERLSGVGRNKILTHLSGDDYLKIVAAMSQVENGVKANMADVMKGFEMQNKIKNK